LPSTNYQKPCSSFIYMFCFVHCLPEFLVDLAIPVTSDWSHNGRSVARPGADTAHRVDRITDKKGMRIDGEIKEPVTAPLTLIHELPLLAVFSRSDLTKSSIPNRQDRGFSRRRLILLRREIPDMGHMRRSCRLSPRPVSYGRLYLSNYKAFFGNDAILRRRYTAIETPNHR